MKIRKVVVAPDSFKGSLSAVEVAGCCEEGILAVFPDAEVVKTPLADGGEGTVAALASSLGGSIEKCRVASPLSGQTTASYAFSGNRSVAVMEMAEASGLTLVEREDRNPLLTTTRGVGEMILDALDKGCREICMGLGGSATNDGGLGMLVALGFVFKDKDGNPLEGRGEDMEKVAAVECAGADPRLSETRFTAACDVDNPFYGNEGAAFVFALQKGADEESVGRLDRGLRNLASVVEREIGIDLQTIAGAGAAGGLGGAFAAFLGARLCRGVDMVLDTVGFDGKLEGADLVITGEGKIDRQSFMGKVLSGVLRRAGDKRVPVIAIGGMVGDNSWMLQEGLVAAVPVLQSATTLDEAMRPEVAKTNIRDAAARIMRIIGIS